MKEDKLSLGIDTSNYKTSVAVVDRDGKILFNHQEFLDVKHGERGLRQSDAFFQHVNRLPEPLESALAEYREQIGIVAVSTRPRPVEGSYMPVFMAGYGYAKAVAAALGVDVKEFSHQEGHIEAVKHYSALKDSKSPLICFHFSGGTTEALFVGEDGSIEIVGGSKDIAYGQVLDRVGVALGFDFPCGQALDEIACKHFGHIAGCENDGECKNQGTKTIKNSTLTKVKVNDCYVNLSGIDTQARRYLEGLGNAEFDSASKPRIASEDNLGEKEIALIIELFQRLGESILTMSTQLAKKYEIKDFIYAGGVSSSKFIRKYLTENMPGSYRIVFGEPALSSDNAVGIALLGGKSIWDN